MISTLDVVWIFDGTIHQPKWKMAACVCPVNGFYFRINSKPFPTAVAITLPKHEFLDHDSYIECSGPLELDDFLIEEGIRERGIAGRVDKGIIPDIIAAVRRTGLISDADKEIICGALEALISKP